jgi:hypothetical protein
MTHRIDLTDAVVLADKAAARMERITGKKAIDHEQGRTASAENAIISKDLLFIAHLCRKAEVEVMDQYHAFKGETSHLGPHIPISN